MSTILQIAKDYYEGWETKDRSKLKVYSGLEFKSPDSRYHFAEEFLHACWGLAGVPLENKRFVSDGNTVCARYDITTPEGAVKSFSEWLTIEEDEIKEIEVFYGEN